MVGDKARREQSRPLEIEAESLVVGSTVVFKGIVELIVARKAGILVGTRTVEGEVRIVEIGDRYRSRHATQFESKTMMIPVGSITKAVVRSQGDRHLNIIRSVLCKGHGASGNDRTSDGTGIMCERKRDGIGVRGGDTTNEKETGNK